MFCETGRYPLYIESTINFVLKQALTMLQNDLEANHSIKYNWAGYIKACLDSYGFHTTRTDGVAGNQAAFLALFKLKMLDQFQQKWGTNISNCEMFATYRISI